jgi:integrase
LDLRWSNYIEKEQRIVKLIKKTKRTHQVKLTKRANSIIKKYKIKDNNKEDYIFPLLKYIEGESISDKIRNNRIAEHNYKSNQLLKIVSKKLDLPFKLTFHSSRHTFATIALKRGMRIEYVSKILGHASIKTTQIYAKIVNEELDKAMSIMDD